LVVLANYIQSQVFILGLSNNGEELEMKAIKKQDDLGLALLALAAFVLVLLSFLFLYCLIDSHEQDVRYCESLGLKYYKPYRSNSICIDYQRIKEQQK